MTVSRLSERNTLREEAEEVTQKLQHTLIVCKWIDFMWWQSVPPIRLETLCCFFFIDKTNAVGEAQWRNLRKLETRSCFVWFSPNLSAVKSSCSCRDAKFMPLKERRIERSTMWQKIQIANDIWDLFDGWSFFLLLSVQTSWSIRPNIDFIIVRCKVYRATQRWRSSPNFENAILTPSVEG